ncbi:MAG TPA: hypothetical protein VFT04_01965 [Gemmatimonadales bacterium]|nr:hypothetical protein [Gemmatimonadales bacterium]
MTDLGSLLLPIIVAAVAVFIASSIIHMGPFWHKRDYPQVPDEERFRAAVGPLNIPQGEYMVPRCFSSSEMKSAEFQAKIAAGPNMILTVLPKGPFRMGGTLAKWFVYTLLVSLFAGYVAGAALPPGSAYLPVFRFAGVTAFLGYAVALWQVSIWWGRSWGMTARTTLDGLIYALVTAGIFGAMWPS